MCSHARFSKVENIVPLRQSLSEPSLPTLLVVTWCWWPPKAVFQLWLSLFGVKCQGIEQKLLALGGISTFSVDVLVLCIRSFPARRAQTALEPSLEITLKSHHCSLKSEKCGTGQPGLSTDKQPSRLQFPIELRFSQSDSFNEQRNFSFFLLFLDCPGAVALLLTVSGAGTGAGMDPGRGC